MESFTRRLKADQVIAAFSEQLATADPDLVKAEAMFPGFSNALGEGIRPLFRAYLARVQRTYRPRMISVFKEVFSEAEAHDAAELYRSPVGRKLMGGVSAGFDGKATIASALRDNEVGDTAVRADVDVAVNRALGGLTPEDLAELERMARTRPALLKLGQLGSRAMPLRVAMENEPLTPQEEDELQRLMEAAATAHIAKFDK